ncbi:hypothetical protein OIU85_022313 [Salix viminalis]|uniref:Uncharacterized protein n=1 Tax=Salix viminalis TaxID=40686 RepID=A0A9Q0U6J5_SALVM|nr:hypothetical protein OIU85_022313 [Salix viminalis]
MAPTTISSSRKAFTSLIIRVNPMYPFLNLFILHPSCLPKGLEQNLDRPLKIWKNASNRRVGRALCVLKNGEILLEYKNRVLVSYDPKKPISR